MEFQLVACIALAYVAITAYRSARCPKLASFHRDEFALSRKIQPILKPLNNSPFNSAYKGYNHAVEPFRLALN